MNRDQKEGRPKEWIERYGVRMYGEPQRDVTREDVEGLKVTTGSLMHVTRHLSGLRPEGRASLEGQVLVDAGESRMVDGELIDAQISSTGSKFNEKLNDPQTVIDFCLRRYSELVAAGDGGVWLKRDSGQVDAGVCLTVTAEQKAELGLSLDESLGSASVVEVADENRAQVRREQRGKGEKHDHIEVNVIDGEAPGTDQLIIVLRQTPGQEYPEFFSAYTGIMTPNLPRPDIQSKEEVAYNKAWWDKRAFIKETP